TLRRTEGTRTRESNWNRRSCRNCRSRWRDSSRNSRRSCCRSRISRWRDSSRNSRRSCCRSRIRLQSLVAKKKVVVTEAIIREALRLDDAEGVDCLPNEEIFTELARMGYEKPSTKLTFSKGKGFSGVGTPLFEGMLIEQEVNEEEDIDEHVKEVNIGDVAEGDDSDVHGEVPTVAKEQSIPSPTPPTPPPQPPQDIPSTSQVLQTPPQPPQVQPPSPRPQPQPQQAVEFPMSLLQEAMDACVALTRRVENLEFDKDDAVVLEDDKDDDREVADAVKDVEEAKLGEEFPTVAKEQSIPSPTLLTPPPQPPQDIPSTSQVLQTPPQPPQVQPPSPRPQPQPQ
nr:hypothetical protein [Tanacetum cinerariifolium]